MKIRPYLASDKQKVLTLLQANTPEFFAPSEQQDLINYLENELEDYFVVEENEEVIGAGGINYFIEEKTARISWDIIKPDSQGKGIGRKLTQHRIALLKANPEINIIVVRTTQLVYQFYEKLGFELVVVEKAFWAKGFDLYQMEMRAK